MTSEQLEKAKVIQRNLTDKQDTLDKVDKMLKEFRSGTNIEMRIAYYNRSPLLEWHVGRESNDSDIFDTFLSLISVRLQNDVNKLQADFDAI